MSTATAFADPHPALTQLRVAALFQWARAGMTMARALASESGRGLIDAARALLRIAQAVRLAIALAMRLSDPANPAFQPTPARTRAARTAETETVAARDQSENEPPEKPEGEPRERFGEHEVSDAAILRRPLAEIVKVICRALGVTPDWSLWTEAVERPDVLAPDPVVAPAPPSAPGSAPARAIPKPPPRPGLIIDRPEPPPRVPSSRARLLSSSAPGALCPVITPIAIPAIGRPRPPEA
jgi:hypothetical protein